MRATSEQDRNEQVSGSSPLVGSLFCLQNPYKRKAPDVRYEGLAAVGQQ
jgi:hypothetical protein